MRYVNQKVVHTHKYLEPNYMIVGIEMNRNAMRQLTGGAYKLYMYLSENKDEYIKYLSFADVRQATGMSKKTYIKAKQELIKAGYLVEREDGDYEFYNKIAPYGGETTL